ncbi:MAG: hypothetical protein AAF039_16465 [Bacteroidota bacterium]
MLQSCEHIKGKNSLDSYIGLDIAIFEEGIISTNDHHEGLSYISPNGDIAIFTRSAKDFSESALYLSRYSDNTWTSPQKIALGNGNYHAGLTFSPDGKKAFYTNKIAVKGRDSIDLWNVWEIEVKKDLEFLSQTAVPVSSMINSDRQDCCLTINSNGKTFFSSDRDGTWDVYTADYVDGSFVNIKKMKYPINRDDSGEWPSHISEDNSTLLFSSIRKNGLGGDDIYVSHFSEGSWQTPTLLNDSVNSKSYEDSAKFTYDNKFLFFASWRDSEFSKGVSNIYIKKNQGSRFPYFPSQ